MIEDKLGHGERLRLECLSQSVAVSLSRAHINESAEHVVQRAKEFENYIIGSGQQSA